jgi:hypothetical protein
MTLKATPLAQCLPPSPALRGYGGHAMVKSPPLGLGIGIGIARRYRSWIRQLPGKPFTTYPVWDRVRPGADRGGRLRLWEALGRNDRSALSRVACHPKCVAKQSFWKTWPAILNAKARR